MASKGRWDAAEGRQVTLYDATVALCDPLTDPAALDVQPGDIIEIIDDRTRWRFEGGPLNRSESVALLCGVVREPGVK
jgi:hypothetical protein